MSLLTPWKIAEVTGGRFIGTQQECKKAVEGAVRDNRDVKPGNLFICIEGQRVDGHDFANDAFSRGAACVLAQSELSDPKGPYVLVESTLDAIRVLAAYYRNLFSIPVVGITGSVGKTSCKEILSSVLSAKYKVHKTQMNLNNDIGVPLTLLGLTKEHEVAVVEMGISDFGDMARLAMMVRPDIFIMTKIGYAHIDNLKDLAGVLKAKTEAFPYMKPDGLAVMNGDDELLRNFESHKKTITFGLEKFNDYIAENITTSGTETTSLDIVSQKGSYSITMPAFGSHLAAIAPAAAAVADVLNMSTPEIQQGFASYESVSGRAKVSVHSGVTLIDDCYNANPNSVKAALRSLDSLAGRRIAVLGDMLGLGENSKQMHYDVGTYAAKLDIDILYCQGAAAKHLAEGFRTAGGTQVKYFDEFQQLYKDLPKIIKKGDTLLIKASRGMHFEKLLPLFE